MLETLQYICVEGDFLTFLKQSIVGKPFSEQGIKIKHKCKKATVISKKISTL